MIKDEHAMPFCYKLNPFPAIHNNCHLLSLLLLMWQDGKQYEPRDRHVKINGSPVSLTENSAVFRKTDFQKKSRIFKNPLSLTVFLLKAISCDNLAEVAAFSRDLTSFLFATMIN